MVLHLVPPTEPSAAERVRQRIRRMDRPDGTLQCNRCGGRSVAKIEAGVIVAAGKRYRGTVIHKDICAECYKRGLIVPMLTELKEAK